MSRKNIKDNKADWKKLKQPIPIDSQGKIKVAYKKAGLKPADKRVKIVLK